MKKYFVGFILGMAFSSALFLAALGLANTTATQNRDHINNINANLRDMRHDIDSLATKRDTIVIEVSMKPQIIKINNK